VVESASEVGGRLVLGSTKTYAERTVRLPRFLRDDLAVYLAGRPRDLDGFVFTAVKGGPLRHTCAALLIPQGAHPKAIQAHLGHSSIQVTMDRYGHLFPDALEQLADRLDAARAAAGTDPARTEQQHEVVELSARQGRGRA
jgi:integrase